MSGPVFPRQREGDRPVAPGQLRAGLSYPAWLALLLGLLLAWRWLALTINGTDLFFDEAQYWAWSQELDFGYYSKPPMVAWVIRAATEVCGINDACIRAPSALIHTATAAIIFLIGKRLYDAHTGFWSALAYATLPAVSASSSIISTDVPLLFFWALALLAYLKLLEHPAIGASLVLGLALGLGLNAKYAMAYFIPCMVVYAFVSARGRAVLRTPWLYLALIVGALLIVPNILWNLDHGGATISHTADNANFSGSLIHPEKMAEFVLTQFGVFGPILFAALLVITWRSLRQESDETRRFLLSFSLPILATVTVLAFLSRAHANWAALSYVAATVLVTAVIFEDRTLRLFRASFVLHGILLVMLAAGGWAAGKIASPVVDAPFGRMLAWRELAGVVGDELARADAAGKPYVAVLTHTRDVTAELIYHLRDSKTPVLAWKAGRIPRDHFELKRPYGAGTGTPLLLVTLAPAPKSITRRFAKVSSLTPLTVQAGGTSRQVFMTRLEGFVAAKPRKENQPAKGAQAPASAQP